MEGKERVTGPRGLRKERPLRAVLLVSAGCLVLAAVVVACSNSPLSRRFAGPKMVRQFAQTVRPPSSETTRLLNNASILRSLGRSHLAVKELEEALQRDPGNLKVVDALAQCYEDLGDFARAQALYEAAVAQNPRHAALRNNLGFSYYQSGEWRKAEACFREAVTLDPGNRQARNNLGLLLVRQGRQAEALTLWQEREGEQAARELLAQALAAVGEKAPAQTARRPEPAPAASPAAPPAPPTPPGAAAPTPSPPRPAAAAPRPPDVTAAPAPSPGKGAQTAGETPAEAPSAAAPRPQPPVTTASAALATPASKSAPAALPAAPARKAPPAAPVVAPGSPASAPAKAPATPPAASGPSKPAPAAPAKPQGTPAPKATAAPKVAPAPIVAAASGAPTPVPTRVAKAPAVAGKAAAPPAKAASAGKKDPEAPVAVSATQSQAQAPPAVSQPGPSQQPPEASPSERTDPPSSQELLEYRLVLLNGNGRQGIARKHREWLEMEGFTVAEVGNYRDFGQERTRISYLSGARRVAQLLARTCYPQADLTEAATLPRGAAVLVVLGRNQLAQEAKVDKRLVKLRALAAEVASRSLAVAPASPGPQAQTGSPSPVAAAAPAPAEATSPPAPALLTAAELLSTRISLKNGNGTPKIARAYRTLLSRQGFTVTEIGNHIDFGMEQTTILYRPQAARVAQTQAARFFPRARLREASLAEGLEVKVVLGKELSGPGPDLLAQLGP
ncbi:MAG: LytR C-terminal domain-containing protein [Syntrophobacterales bacterium]|nr:LytR C-terminal domain-containing protein [Syntrophobacterales bacterium]